MNRESGSPIFRKVRSGCMRILLIAILFHVIGWAECKVAYGQDTESKSNSEKNDVKLAEPYNLNRTGYDVVYAIDNSGSVWEQQDIRDQAIRNITNLAVGADIRVGAVYFADHVYDTLALTAMEDQEGSQRVLDFLDMRTQDTGNQDTNIGNALEKAANLFDSQDPSRERIVILFSDGMNENSVNDSGYKLAADQKTEEQTIRLKDMSVKIYCVYLQKGRNDETYLQSLVNYFSDEKDYASERFSKVTEDEIDSLSEKFAAVFFAMQNNMKYRKFEPDSSGRMNFYIPSLGAEKLQVYLDGNIQKSELSSVKDSQYTVWKDGTATFMDYGKPKAGDCTIGIDSPDLPGVSGTVACYAYLQAEIEMNKNEKSKADKDREYQMAIHFYDRKGEEVQIDPMANVEAKVILTNEEGEETEIAPTMKVEEGIAKSDAFVIEEYGSYSYEVHVAYEDFIDLRYSAEGGAIKKTAPTVHNMENGKFLGKKTKDGKMTFSIKESELYEDEEGEEIKIEKVTQLNKENQVTATQSDGYINVETDGTGEVNFTLQIVDGSGMEAEVTIQGELSDEALRSKVIIIIICALLVFGAIVLSVLFYIRRMNIKLGKMFLESDRIDIEFQKTFNMYREEKEKFQKNMSYMRRALYGDENVRGLLEFAELLDEDQREDFGLNTYRADGYIENMLSEGENIIKDNANITQVIETEKINVEEIKKNPTRVLNANKKIKKYCEMVSKELKTLKEKHESLKVQNEKIHGKVREMGITAGTIDEMLERNIRCKLSVAAISAMPYERALKICRDDGGKYIKGFYKLDDARVLGNGNLGQNIGNTGIYVYGYEDDKGTIGLEIRSVRGFRCCPMSDGTEPGVKKEAVILKGNCYKLKVEVNGQEIDMRLKVR